jgi:hypothetical protein
MRTLLRTVFLYSTYDYVIAFIRLTVHLHATLLTVTSMVKLSFTKARRRFLRNRFLMHPQRFLILPLVMIFYILFMQKRNVTHSPDPFSAKRYFPGWKTYPAVFVSADNPQVDDSGPLYMLELGSAKPISNSSITVALPVTEKSAQTLELTIIGLLEYQSTIQEVVMLCPESLLSTVRSSIRNTIASYGESLPTLLTLLPCPPATCSADALIGTAFHVSTDWTLFLEDSGLRQLNRAALLLLLNPPAVTFPLGVKGFALPTSEAHNQTCLTPLASHRPADFLVPPLVLPGFTLSDVYALPDLTIDSWSALGRWVSEERPDMIGGVIINRDLAAVDCSESNLETQDTSNRQRLSTPIDDYHPRIFGPEPPSSIASNRKSHGHFGVFFPSRDDLAAFSQSACGLVAGGHHLDILLYSEADHDQASISTDTCTLHFHSTSSATTAVLIVSSWLSQSSGPFDVIISLTAEDKFTASLLLSVRDSEHGACTVVQLPREDLIYSDWMGALSLTEWKSMLFQLVYDANLTLIDWNIPSVQISIITNNRPHSLLRLLRSLENSRYFGDTLDLRLNMEDSADPITKQLAADLQWEHGTVFVHHRIAHGGLLTAVVESWYPRSNDSYGLLLEDDVEVSPLFYAWLKLALLRYR